MNFRKLSAHFLVLGGFALFASGVEAKVCKGFGPQTPRDISSKEGSNSVLAAFAPSYENLNLCNIHFHKQAEHKGPGFSVSAGDGKHGGFKCNDTSKLTTAQMAAPKNAKCENIKPGDTIEVHWVYSSCDVDPGKGLGACLSDSCANPQLRVETQVFLLANDENAADFGDFTRLTKTDGLSQVRNLPSRADTVKFIGSTTGPSFTEETCSPLQVSWSVPPQCMTVDINSVHEWCEDNKFEENHAHGVRQLVTNKKLLSTIQ